MNKEKLAQLAKDLRKVYPRSSREVLGGYVILPLYTFCVRLELLAFIPCDSVAFFYFLVQK